MADDADVTAERTQLEESIIVADICRQAAAIPAGEAGECWYCGEEFSRVVTVIDPASFDSVSACGRCRDIRKL